MVRNFAKKCGPFFLASFFLRHIAAGVKPSIFPTHFGMSSLSNPNPPADTIHGILLLPAETYISLDCN
jgi:hypothetical protein